MSARLLTQLLGTFRHRFPGIETVVFEGSDAEIVSWLDQGIVDAGLISHHQEDRQSFLIVPDELLIVVSGDHRLARQSSVQVSDMVDEPFVMPKSGCVNIIRHLFQDAHKGLNLQLELSDINTVLAMVKEGLGITLIPNLSLPDDLSGLHTLHLEPPVYRQLSAIVNSAKAMSPATRAFIELTQACPGLDENLRVGTAAAQLLTPPA
jgi:DNA-binding transcriptional LysR family regulator